MTEQSSERHSGGITDANRRSLRVRIAMKSDVGRVRSENQDFAIVAADAETNKGHLMIVADGMGGHKGGATASRIAANSIRDLYVSSEGEDVAAILRDAIEQANASIYRQAAENEDLEGMGTTTSVLLIRDDHAWTGHVGDSRIYRFRGGETEQMTDDHSLVATMVREGLLSAEEAETHPRRNVLQRSMGVSSDVDADVAGPIDLVPGDRFLLCSDGLHGLVNSGEMAEIIGDQDIEAAAEKFVDLALERGAPDNVTVIVAAVDEAEDGAGVEPAPASAAAEQDRSKPVEPKMGASGCLLRTLLIALAFVALAGSFFLLVAGDLFVSWFSNAP